MERRKFFKTGAQAALVGVVAPEFAVAGSISNAKANSRSGFVKKSACNSLLVEFT